MNRRQLLKGGCGLLFMGTMQTTAADSAVAYTRDVYEEALSSGKPFMLDFYAPW